MNTSPKTNPVVNPFEQIGSEIKTGAEIAVAEAAHTICEEMKSNLVANGHEGTGALMDSINFEVTNNGEQVSVVVNADYYAQFLEHGTGAAHGVAGGREGTWRYQDREGNWHTTDGMDADPFIEPAVTNVTTDLSNIISAQIRDELLGKGGKTNG